MFSEDLQTILIDVFESICSPVSYFLPIEKIVSTYTLAAHLVTFRPSFRQSSSPRP
jgi:hypothetical protein